ncbi:phage integrase N-terminal SAM-like domain-containing protein [Serpentinicella sp. ANB-PHB4]|uniref:phage integrase N-terminal domain-containing protein n=1 Tax=Serpentinicella sp. ANB-PHB4 TaxID=3074076 RepID=UPI00286207C0|nr:phage integrase N-terminal domain-containing protein [Serpentinicella sp. ANB-PHB4]MDR5659864.1 phage integrase N-terminal SAM-like domain-containing protein [Serpentinicella sp. ANB-PHB4]
MPRMSYLDYQMHERMEEMKCIGQSRHKAKEEYRQAVNEKSFNRTVGIHSYKTYDAYKQTSKEFIKYIRAEYKDIKNISQISKGHIIEYLQIRQEQGKSMYTVSKDMAALNKLFNTNITKKEANIDQRSYKYITRSRENTENDRKYNPDNYRYQMLVAKATGCRRESILKIKPENFITGENNLPEKVHLKEKGGKERYATILKEHREELKEFLKDKKEGETLFNRYTKKIDNHAFRAEYAKERYKELVNEKGEDKKDYRGFDKKCLEKLRL